MVSMSEGRRRASGLRLLGVAVALFAAFLTLPVVQHQTDKGWQLVGRVVALTIDNPTHWFDNAVRLTALHATCGFVVVVAALVAGFRMVARIAACFLLGASWFVAGVVISETPQPLNALGWSIRDGRGTFGWFACFPVLAAAAFVWPRPARPPEDMDGGYESPADR